MENVQKIEKYNLYRLPIIRGINAFVYSKAFVIFIAILTVLSNAYALDLYYFCAITVFAIYVALFGKDFSPYIHMLCFCYIASSVENNPGVNANSILFPQNSGYLLFYLAGAIILSMLARFILDPSIGFKNMFKQKRRLSVSIILLGVTYFISGILSKGYFGFALKNFAIAGLQFAVIFVPYFILSFAVKWDSIPKDYLVFTGVIFGFAVCVELIFVYVLHGIIANPLYKWKTLVYTGWGISNNIGALITMTIPFAFYYVCKSRFSAIWLLVIDIMCLMVMFSLSRASILVGLFFMLVGTVLAIVKAKPRTKLLTTLNLLLLSLLVWIFGWAYFKTLYVSLGGMLASDSRVELYKLGLKTFLDYPIFGNGWYSLSIQSPNDFNFEWSNELSFTSFFPARWHNTVIQLLVTGGVMALIAYLVHRYKTLSLCYKKRSLETLVTFFAISALLIESLLDCHFFNLGPVLFYSVALAFVEFRIPHFTESAKFKEYVYDINENCLLK